MNRSELQIRIDEIADDFLKERRDGLAPKIDDYIKSNSDIAEPLRDFLKMILMVDDCAGESDFQSANQPRINEGTDDFPTIPDYEIIREVGRGGMGIVYEAQQLSLDRTVALKLLPASLFNHPQAIDRFELEAKSAAKLHHSHIVPVFDVGRQEKNRYYTMQFIEGQSLDHVIESIRTLKDASAADKKSAGLSETVKMGLSTTTAGRKPFYRNVATLGQRVASALDYAHENGVVHRDIKPANLMLDPENSVWIMDFGLAKTEESDLTHTGDVVGTIRYMSPERFAGQCDQRSDIYSLGMTLYELLSQRSAFGEINRLELIQAIKSDEPESLRKTDRQIPRDLETIVEKAINKDPRRRYATAGELSSDLQRFVNGQPIRARRVGSVERLWLWARKHKALAASLSALAILLMATSIGSVVAAFYFRDLADTTTKAAKRSADSLEIFTSAFLSATVKENPDARANMKATEVLQNALNALQESELDAGGQQEMLESLGQAMFELGDYDGATEAYSLRMDKLEELFGTREPDFPEGIGTLESVPEVDWILNTKTQLAELRGLDGEYDECLKLHLENFEFTLGECLEGDRRRVNSTANLATAYMKMEKWDEAVELLETAVADSENVKGEPYQRGAEIREFLATSLASVGSLKRAETSISVDDGELDRGIQMLEAALEKAREDGLDWMGQASNLAGSYSQNGQYDLAIELYDEAIDAYEARYGDDHPDTINAMNGLGECYWKKREFDRSVDIYRDVAAASEKKLGRDNPLTRLAIFNLGVNLLSGGEPLEAIENLEEIHAGDDENAVQTVQYLLVAYCLTDDDKKFEAFVDSELDGDMEMVAGVYANYSRHFRKNFDYEAAIQINEREIEIREELPNTWKLDFAIGSLGELHAESGDLEKAMALIEDSRKALENRIDELPQSHLNFIIALPVHTLLDAVKENGSPEDIATWTAEAERVDGLYGPSQ